MNSRSPVSLQPRRVLIVCPAGIVGGKETISLCLAKGLRDRGIDASFVTSKWGNGDFKSRLLKEGFDNFQLRLGYISMSRSWKSIRMTCVQLQYLPSLWIGYRNLINQLRPEIIIHTNWHHGLLLAPALDPTRDIFWAHDLMASKKREALIFRLIARRVGSIACVSRAVERSMRSAGVSDEKIQVIHNGFSAPPQHIQSACHRPIRLGIVGQVGPWKGHDDLIDALAILKTGRRDVKLSVFGKGASDYVDRLRRKANDLGVADDIEWHGFFDNAAEIFSTIDICIVPSRFDEPFGMSALEAMAFGKAVICSAKGGLRELVQDGVSGLMVNPGAPNEIAIAVEKFLGNPALIVEMGNAARQRAEAEFSQNKLIDRFINLFGRMKAQPSQTSIERVVAPR
jgi:glycosyltransferase involved in cell wall biosynthesis